MQKTALISLVAAASFAGAFTFAAEGGGKGHPRAADIRAANALTTRAKSVHYHLAVTLTKSHTPTTLHIDGASARGQLLANLSLGAKTGKIMLDKNFLYESASQGTIAVGNFSWLRTDVGHLSPGSHVMSTLRSLTPSPLLHIVAEAKLRLYGPGVFAGTVAYDDPVVRTSLRDLANGFEFRDLRLRVVVGRDGLIHRLRLTGHSADRKTAFALRAQLYGFGRPVKITPPAPGTFMDLRLEQLQA